MLLLLNISFLRLDSIFKACNTTVTEDCKLLSLKQSHSRQLLFLITFAKSSTTFSDILLSPKSRCTSWECCFRACSILQADECKLLPFKCKAFNEVLLFTASIKSAITLLLKLVWFKFRTSRCDTLLKAFKTAFPDKCKLLKLKFSTFKLLLL